MGNSYLRFFFRPATAVMNRLRYPGKFALIALLFAIPIGVATYFFVSEVNFGIQFAKKERIGIEYLSSAKEFLQHVQQHRGMTSAFLNGAEEFLPPIITKKNQIQQIIVKIDDLDVRFGGILGTHKNWKQLKNEWNQLESEFRTMTPEENFTAHTNLSENIVLLMAGVGDTSNLITDPYLDTYYLMDTIVNRIPATSERLGQIRAFALTIPVNQKLTVNQKRLFFSLSASAKSSLRALSRGMNIALKENSFAGSLLAAKLEKTEQAVDSFLKLVDQEIILADVNALQAERYYQAATDAINEVFSLYDSTAPVLDQLLEKRINEFSIREKRVLSFLALILLAIFYLFAGFYLAVREVIDSLKKTTEQVAKGEVGKLSDLKTKDELGEVVLSFNFILRAFASANKELQEDIAKRTAAENDLRKKTDDLERFNHLMIDRELRMAELKKENQKLKEEFKKF